MCLICFPCTIAQTVSLLGLFLCLAGCGGDGTTVSGQVLFDGEPIPEGTITFAAAEEAALSTQIQAIIINGQFVIEKNQSLQPGNYKVAVRATRKVGQAAPEPGSAGPVDRFEQYIPVEYNSRTGLSAEITGDVDDLLFELQSPPRNRGRGR